VFIHGDQNSTHWVLLSAKHVCLILSQFLKCTQLEPYLFVFKDLQIRQVVSVLKVCRRHQEGLWLHEILVLALGQGKRPSHLAVALRQRKKKKTITGQEDQRT
jgi:hypothetical protein